MNEGVTMPKKLSLFEKRLLLVLVPCSVWAFVSMIALCSMDQKSFAFIWFDLSLIVVCFGCLVWARKQLKKRTDDYCRHIGDCCSFAGKCSSDNCPLLRSFMSNSISDK